MHSTVARAASRQDRVGAAQQAVNLLLQLLCSAGLLLLLLRITLDAAATWLTRWRRRPITLARRSGGAIEGDGAL